MRFLLVNRFFGGSQTPTGRMLEDVARELVGRGHDVDVLTSRGAYAGAQTDSELDSVSIRALWTPRDGRLAPWVVFLAQAALMVPLWRWDRLLVLTDPPMLPTVALLTPKLRRRIYWWTMDLYPEALAAHGMLPSSSLFYRGLRALNDLALARADGVISLGGCQSARLRAYRGWPGDGPACHIEVPPWDYRPIHSVPRTQNRLLNARGWQDRKLVLYAGNLGEAHSYEELLSAARLLAEDSRSEWMFVFVCRGGNRPRLERDAAGLRNVAVMDYLPSDQTADLLWSASVHVITMREGWEGVVVPSKLYGVLQTDAPVLFIGSPNADTALEIERYERGCALPCGASGRAVIAALEQLAKRRGKVNKPQADSSRQIADFVST